MAIRIASPFLVLLGLDNKIEKWEKDASRGLPPVRQKQRFRLQILTTKTTKAGDPMRCGPCAEKKCTKGTDCTGLSQEMKARYVGEDLKMLLVADHLTENYYMQKTRLEEILAFAAEMDYRKLGLAFCSGLKEEAEIIDKILSREFKVFSAICKVCGIAKSAFRPGAKEKSAKPKISCNPIGQAELLNRRKTQLNIVVGLCLGHDILFTKHSKAPVTTLVVKDRVLAHNPIGAVYSGFYRKKRFQI